MLRRFQVDDRIECSELATLATAGAVHSRSSMMFAFLPLRSRHYFNHALMLHLVHSSGVGAWRHHILGALSLAT